MVEVYAHFLGFLWLLALALFLEIELQLLAKLKKYCCINRNARKMITPPQADMLIPMCIKQRFIFYFLVPSLSFLANNSSGVLIPLTDVSILFFLSPSYTHHVPHRKQKSSEIIPMRC